MGMTFEEYKQTIDEWTALLAESQITLSTGKPVPKAFWKTFLGIKRKVHQDIYNGTYKVKQKLVPAYLSRSIVFTKNLEHDVFLRLVTASIKGFEVDKSS
jgi:hypothetical protein